MCRCAERRGALVRAGSALLRGDAATVRAETAFVITTAAQDVRVFASKKAVLAASHKRLKR